MYPAYEETNTGELRFRDAEEICLYGTMEQKWKIRDERTQPHQYYYEWREVPRVPFKTPTREDFTPSTMTD